MKQKKLNLKTQNNDDEELLMYAIVEDAATGKRFVLLPRGVVIFLFVMTVLPIFATVLLGGGSISWFMTSFSIGEQVFAQFATGFVCLFLMYGSMFKIFHGHKKYVNVAKFYLRFLSVTSLVFMMYYSAVYNELNQSFMWASIVSSFTLLLMHSSRYKWYVEYMYLLKKRKLEIYEAEQQSAE